MVADDGELVVYCFIFVGKDHECSREAQVNSEESSNLHNCLQRSWLAPVASYSYFYPVLVSISLRSSSS